MLNHAKKRLQDRETVFGCFVRYPQAGLAELVALQGWDFLVLDAEHGVLEPCDVEHMVRSAEVHDVSCFVRVPSTEPATLLRFLDTGAVGVHAPTVGSADHAAAIVQAVKYHPLGQRGLAGVRAAKYGQRESLAQYIQTANAQTLIAAHLETAEAIEQLPGICATDHVDVIFIGPTDLSHSLGVPGETNHPRVRAAMDRIVDETLAAKKILGVLVGDVEAAHAWQQRGARYLAVTLESMVRKSCQAIFRACGQGR